MSKLIKSIIWLLTGFFAISLYSFLFDAGVDFDFRVRLMLSLPITIWLFWTASHLDFIKEN